MFSFYKINGTVSFVGSVMLLMVVKLEKCQWKNHNKFYRNYMIIPLALVSQGTIFHNVLYQLLK